MNPILVAADIARSAHHGQFRKFTGEPYLNHPGRVAAGVMVMKSIVPEEMVCAAFLHDVLEDCDAHWADTISAKLGRDVLHLVRELTNDKYSTDIPRALKKQSDRTRLRSVSFRAQRIKMLDRIDNLRDIHLAPLSFRATYLIESAMLLDVLKDADVDLAQQLDEAIDSAVFRPAASR